LFNQEIIRETIMVSNNPEEGYTIADPKTGHVDYTSR